LEAVKEEGIPLFVLGGGANILAADGGIRGIVLDTGANAGPVTEGPGRGRDRGGGDRNGPGLWFRAGTPVDAAAEEAARRGLSGLEFLAGMPGSAGGALWMNARCYGRETADTAEAAALLEFGAEPGAAGESGADAAAGGRLTVCSPDRNEFGYKKSPFQDRDAVILAVYFALQEKEPGLIRAEMEDHRKDREAKGHYRLPSAGSVFKNNRAFGKPTGRIIDELGLKGLSVGNAQVAPWHGNIIVNRGGARAAEIRALVEEVQNRVRAERGFDLEPEILFAGDWGREKT
jgi:UDP-N-acetylmuramate dehydrogenase